MQPDEMDWHSYDPSWLVLAAGEQEPRDAALQEALAASTRARWRDEQHLYLYFIDGSRPNQPGSPWQFDHNIVLERTPEGLVVLDVLKDGRVGGIEFLDRVMDAHRRGTLK